MNHRHSAAQGKRNFPPDDPDAFAVARLLHGHQLNGAGDRISDQFRPMIERIAAAEVGDREQILDAEVRSIVAPDEADAFIEAVAAVDPNGAAPEAQVEEPEPWDSPESGGQKIAATPFPIDVLPPDLARLVSEGSIALQCPPDYLAAPALGLAGGAIGLSVNLRVSTTWTEAPDLTIAGVGDAGTKKSPALRAAAGPAYAIDRELREAYLREVANHRIARRIWEAAAKATGRDKADPGPEPEAPVHGHLTIDDATREGVTHIHSQNLRGLIVIKDELAAWALAMNVYRSGKGDDRQFWMSVRSGSLVKVTRRGNPEPLIIARPMVPVLGCLTPAMLPSIGEGPDDGWLDRILFAYPDSSAAPPRGYTDAEISQDALDAWDRAFRRLWGRRMVAEDNGRLRPYFVRLTDGARARWKAWMDDHWEETRRPDFDRTLVGPWSKLEGFTLRLALILSQLRWAFDETADPDAPPPDVARQDIEGAAKLTAYFKVHFRRVKAELAGDAGELPEDSQAILDLAERNRWESFTENQANEALARFRGNPKRRAAAVQRLVDHHYIRAIPPAPRPKGQRGRRPSPSYEVNPAVIAAWRAVNTPPGEVDPSGNSLCLNKLNILNAPLVSGMTRGEG